MTVWVDADSCPIPVRTILIRAADRRKVPTVFVADRTLPIQPTKYVSTALVESDIGSADRHILSAAGTGDLVITRDIPLASELVKKGIDAVSDRGTVLNSDNIGERLSMRNLMYELREGGIQTERQKPATGKDVAAFANAFDREITRLLKR